MITISPVRTVLAVSATVDVPENVTQYEVVLAYDPVNTIYVVSIPNLGKSIKTRKPKNIDYKLRERKVLGGDAKAIQDIVSGMLLPRLEELSGF